MIAGLPGALSALAHDRHIVVCCGSGGVGKTTTAAAFALQGARLGRNAVVVTIDPAKRLANALGIDVLSDTASEIDRSLWDPAGDAVPGGHLWALMLDTKSTFDRLVVKYSPDPEQGRRILENRFYRNISGALSGTQEYMAMEELHELHEEGGFDLIVVDTPPTRNALDFLDAPARLTRLLDNKLFRLVMAPTRAGFRVANFALQAFFRTVSRIIGTEVVDDLVMFFQAFEGMEDGFRQRARKVTALLADRATAFVLVTSPRRDALAEAGFFARRLKESRLAVDALVVNRVNPDFGGGSADDARARAGELPPGPLRDAYANLGDFLELSARESRHLAGVELEVGAVPVVRVPLLPVEVADLGSLQMVGTHLFGSGGG
jgi:anion-transporting  ArsA/GET3 family ATPase